MDDTIERTQHPLQLRPSGACDDDSNDSAPDIKKQHVHDYSMNPHTHTT